MSGEINWHSDRAETADRETATFDYGVPAELFMAKRKAGHDNR
jgi:hypothetical protein